MHHTIRTARLIWRQLGGEKLKKAARTHELIYDLHSITVIWKEPAANKADRVRVSLGRGDEDGMVGVASYTVEFFRLAQRPLAIFRLSRFEGVPFDQLRMVFTRETGIEME